MAASTVFKPFKDSGTYTSSFKSADGEVYLMSYRCNAHMHEGFVTLQWTNTSSKSVRLSRHEESKGCTFEILRLSGDNSSHSMTSMTICLKYFRNSIVFINIIPLACLTKSEVVPTEGATTSTILLTRCSSKPQIRTQLEQLTTDMKNLLDSAKFSDVILTDGSEEIRAHKSMLSARSSVFDKMFQHPTKENIENRIVIEDISIEILRELLHFMYTGTVAINDWHTASELYVAADKYDVKDLVSICSSFLKEVDLSNVLDTLILADLYRDGILREAALSFISSHYWKLKKHQEWKKFMEEHQDLAINALSAVIDMSN